MRMYQAPGRCYEGRISGELENYSTFSERGDGERERVESAVDRRTAFLQTRELGYLPGAVQEWSGSKSIPGY